jgi:GT2 family glycosyltransferase
MESKNNYLFVTATRKNINEFWEKSQLALSLNKLGLKEHTEVVEQNKDGLGKVYNTFIRGKNNNKHIIFIHDDVLVEDLFFIEKLDLAFEKYSVVGLAGSKKVNLASEIAAWHIMSQREDFVGEVAHSKDGKYWTTVFGPTDSRALLVDGLFIGVTIKDLLEKNVIFDENFTFHHYDLDFSLQLSQNKIKCGVFPIKVTHFGLGDSMNSDEWRKSNEKFKQKWNKPQ